MELIVPVLLNIFLAIGIYLIQKNGKFENFSNTKKQILIGVCFGIVSAFASSFGVDITGVVINVRDAAPITAGLLFGPISGIIAGLMGGIYRAVSVLWGAGTYTVVACTISTIIAGCSASLLRKYMFDDKRPTITYAVGITIVLEVFHMLMIFITNFHDANTAFLIIRQCTILMVVANSFSVGTAVFALSLISKDFKFIKLKREKGIADRFQIWLFLSIIIAFLVTSIFTFNIQSEMNEKNIEEVFSVAMKDTIADIRDESDDNLLEIVKVVKEKYLQDTTVNLSTLLNSNNYSIQEINIVSKAGIITKSTTPLYVDYKMNSSDQSKEFLILTNQKEDKYYVQTYMQNKYGEYRKYAGASLPDGGFIQVGYNSESFRNKLDSFVVDIIKNRHVGAEGFILICDENLKLVTSNEYDGLDVSAIGIKPNEEMLNKKQSTEIYNANIISKGNEEGKEYIYVFAFSEGYCIIAAMPEQEATFMRAASMYLSLFMQVIIFAVLFVLIFYLIKKIIVNNLHKINDNLSEITGGNLEVKVDVRSSEEFSSLSDDINTTVATLKRYIAEAAARIDRELEYAKQIQLSALPTNLTDNEDFSIYAGMIAAKEVGGDFYDFYQLNEEKIAILVADVSGKGIPAAMFMMTAKTIIKDLAESGLEVDQIFTRANEKLCENNESGMFVTAWMGILDINTGLLQYANAGHNPPLIINNSDNYEYLKSRAGFILGGMDGIKYRKSEMTLQKGDRIFLYTDGVTEATNIENELYGESRLLQFMNQNTETSSKYLLSKIKDNIDEFVGEAPQADDITMLIFKYKKEKDEIIEKEFNAVDSELNNVLAMFEETLESYECSMKNITAICVAIEEIFVNISHYAYGNDIGKCKITIKFNKATRQLTMIMEDTGVPFNPLSKQDPDITLSAEDRKIGGLGIYIVKKTMDELTYRYENETNILTMKKII